ncbi:uncharacterized protein DS421_18g623260 [Arachis hypogaea]|uniref:Uncharacterized protein n=1 Tax=Arachis hypogaea TaxID=3818 RepID=A0A6B9VAG1_ARAHY|nr:uncharacterized protein DS421_19g654910 [Arachis hypogaea]QHN96954.1 uncharacterized protein DS421_18g623260 [Arachis hypogaea]
MVFKSIFSIHRSITSIRVPDSSQPLSLYNSVSKYQKSIIPHLIYQSSFT